MTRFGKIQWVGDAMPDLRRGLIGNPPIPMIIQNRQAVQVGSTSDEIKVLDEILPQPETESTAWRIGQRGSDPSAKR